MNILSQGFSTLSWRQTGKYMESADHVIFNPEKLGVTIKHFIRGEELTSELKYLSPVGAFFSNIPAPAMILSTTAPPHLF